jgi:phage terminase large subunit GpA-like protein
MVKGKDGGSFVTDPKNACIQCEKCKSLWGKLEHWDAVQKLEWRNEKPTNKIAGFWINQLYDPYIWHTVGDLAVEFLAVKDKPSTLKTFINTVLAEVWTEGGERPDHEKLMDRREHYAFNNEAVIPMRGLFLTAMTDVQESPPRLEVEVKAWGRNLENWSIGYWVLQAFAENGQPLPATSPELWAELEKLLVRNWPHASGITLPIWVMCIDTGSLPKPVYNFAIRHARPIKGGAGLQVAVTRTVVPTKGDDNELQIISQVSKEDAARQRQHIYIVSIGTHCAKREIYTVLRDINPRRDPFGKIIDEPTAGLYHFPNYDGEYFKQLTSEVRIEKPNGDVVWEKRGRNEVFDLAVGNRAAAALVGIDRPTFPWATLEAAVLAGPLVGVAEVEQMTGESDPQVDTYSADMLHSSSSVVDLFVSVIDSSESSIAAGKPSRPEEPVPAAPPVQPPPPPQPTAAQLARQEWERSVSQSRAGLDSQGNPIPRPSRPIRGRFGS